MKLRRSSCLVLMIFAVSFSVYTAYNLKIRLTEDKEGPVIHMETTELSVSVKDGDEVLLKDVTAIDEKDGDVSDSLVIESISEFVAENERYVNYAAFDSDNHVTKISRKIIYTDYEPIRFTLHAPLRFSVSSSANEILRVVGANDCIDGNISDAVDFSDTSNILLSQASDYQVVFEVSNSAGDRQQLPATVTIYKTSDVNNVPQIELKEYLVYTEKGKSLDPKSYLDKVTYSRLEYEVVQSNGTFASAESGISANERENPTVSYDQFVIYDNVDYQTPGVYEIQYSLEDNNSNKGSVNLIVVVEEE